jgi:hypothetical protein
MAKRQVFWVHPTSYTYRVDEPEKLLETLWVERPGWGYLMRSDLWLSRECSEEELLSKGYREMVPVADGQASLCPFCRMYICDIPGYLVEKHMAECGGGRGEPYALLENAINEQRRVIHERRILEAIQRAKEELEEAERRERFDRIREEQLERQQQKDRKKRLKEEVRDQLRNR